MADIRHVLVDKLYENVPEGTEENHVKCVSVAFVRVEV